MDRSIVTVYKKVGGEIKSRRVHAIDLPAWLKDGWTLEDQSAPAAPSAQSADNGGGSSGGDGKHELLSVAGVSPKVLEKLLAEGVDTREKLAAMSVEDIESIKGIGTATADKIISSVKEE